LSLQKQAKAKASRKSNKFVKEKAATIEAKIHELEMQMQSARFGFDRASKFADGIIRKQRECFRLASRLPALVNRIEFEEIVVRSQFLVVMGETGNSCCNIISRCIVKLNLAAYIFNRFGKKYTAGTIFG